MRHLKRPALLGLLLLACLLLAGCRMDSTMEELFTLPRLPTEYTTLSRQLDQLLSEGYEYMAPTSGRNIQSLQMVDIDGDGRDEALAFFRLNNGEKPLKIYVFHSREDSYELTSIIESSGTAIDSIYYEDLTGEEALEMLQQHSDIRVALLDVMLPGIDGFEVCRRIRATNSRIGIIMLTARSQEMDRVTGLMTGADDYVTKPFSPAELTARVDALMRRSGGSMEEHSGEISQPPFLLNTRNRTLEKNGKPVKLTQVEYSIMRMFMENPGKALSREEILDLVWGRDYFGELKIVDVNIRRLRLKIEDNATNPTFISTVWGYGYKWDA